MTKLPTREAHLALCKEQALQLIANGDLEKAFDSMMSDLMKHPETRHHDWTNLLGMQLQQDGELDTPEKMREWIEGYN